jgi:hypothetical protein
MGKSSDLGRGLGRCLTTSDNEGRQNHCIAETGFRFIFLRTTTSDLGVGETRPGGAAGSSYLLLRCERTIVRLVVVFF